MFDYTILHVHKFTFLNSNLDNESDFGIRLIYNYEKNDKKQDFVPNFSDSINNKSNLIFLIFNKAYSFRK